MTRLFPICIAVATLSTVAPAAEDEAARARFFEERVRPLLVEHCGECHGSKNQYAELRLDHRGAAFRGGENGPVIVPGQPEQSRLIQAIRYEENELDLEMPPDGKLPDEAIAVLTKWIADGAYWPEAEADREIKTADDLPHTAEGELDFEAIAELHWAYQPIHRPAIPEVQQQDQVRNPIDRFILARLEEQQLSLSPSADRGTLVRRASFGLLGLPPEFEAVQRFEQDGHPGAWERLVDRLLASPAYGERWGRHWLDVARYADTRGYIGLGRNAIYPYAYTYRDYTIRAFNDDKPYDQFLIEQIAADQLGLEPDDPALAAMGFLTVGPRFINNQQEIINDRIDLITRGLLGMTLACSRCHDHKYDPLPTADYYSLYGVLASSTEPDDLPVIGTPDPDSPAYQQYQQELAKRQQAIDDYKRTAHAELIAKGREHITDYLLALVKQSGKLPDGVEVSYEGGDPRRSLLKLWGEYLKQHQSDPVFRPWQALLDVPADQFAAKSAEVLPALEADDQPENPLVMEALRKQPLMNLADVARVYGSLLRDVHQQWQSLKSQPENADLQQLPDANREQLRQVLYGGGSPTAIPLEQAARVFERDHRDQLIKLEKAIDDLNVNSPGAPQRAMVVADRPQPVEPVIFVRGSQSRRGDRVPRRFPQILSEVSSEPFQQGSGRLELAKAIAGHQNPLTARVIVNRVWSHHFGTGLVATASDFGFRGEPPSHPQLLDYLASELIASDWSIKHVQRLILTSTTYRQQSVSHEAGRKADPENRLLWRMNRRRLEFEPMRDSLLHVAGELDRSMYGRSQRFEDAAMTRRAVYGFYDRNNFDPLLRTFDFPSLDATSPGRPETTVPQQALYAMNSDFLDRMAKRVAEELAVSATSPQEQTEALFRRILSREPTAQERKLVSGFLAGGEPNAVQAAHALLMSNEFLFVD